MYTEKKNCFATPILFFFFTFSKSLCTKLHFPFFQFLLIQCIIIFTLKRFSFLPFRSLASSSFCGGDCCSCWKCCWWWFCYILFVRFVPNELDTIMYGFLSFFFGNRIENYIKNSHYNQYNLIKPSAERGFFAVDTLKFSR
jgi:hypothetical protein